MRIEVNHGPQTINQNQATSGQSAARTSNSGTSAIGEDQAQLSGAHLQVQALAAQASQMPEVRQERVQALRQAIQSGHYNASPEQVAGAVIDHMTSNRAA
ncbi:MAG TPA: flagellar biosynthesis anti-sigma factor FlgM [Verrucomicrobiae bacterium]|nr:flagellar biosynthesis anti-sigma factor FlgM [Verrucomicrobiae bacterium]